MQQRFGRLLTKIHPETYLFQPKRIRPIRCVKATSHGSLSWTNLNSPFARRQRSDHHRHSPNPDPPTPSLHPLYPRDPDSRFQNRSLPRSRSQPPPPPPLLISTAGPLRRRPSSPSPISSGPSPPFSAGPSSPPPHPLLFEHPNQIERHRTYSANERCAATQEPRRRGWLARQRVCARFDAPRSVELAGPRRVRGLPRVCGGGATHRPRVSGHQHVANASVGGRRLPRAACCCHRRRDGTPR